MLNPYNSFNIKRVFSNIHKISEPNLFLYSPLAQSQDFLLHMPVGNGGLVQEPAPADRLTTAAPTLPMLPAPDLTTPMTADTVCSCDACNERRCVTSHSSSPLELL